jgi:hypothetical protein
MRTTGHHDFAGRLQKKPADPGSKPDDSPSDIARKKFYRWVNTRLGWPLAALLAVFALWVGWDKLEKLPGVAPALSRLAELRGISRASGDKFSILIARIDNDKAGVPGRLIYDALQGRLYKEIEVLLPERTISLGGADKPREAVKAGHERAQALLWEANANVMN